MAQTEGRMTEEEYRRRWTRVIEYIVLFVILLVILGMFGGALLLVAEILAFALILAISAVIFVYLFARPQIQRRPPEKKA